MKSILERLHEQEDLATEAWAFTRAEVIQDTIKLIKHLAIQLNGCELELKYADKRIKAMQKEVLTQINT